VQEAKLQEKDTQGREARAPNRGVDEKVHKADVIVSIRISVVQEAELQEKDAQHDREQSTREAAEKRTQPKVITEKDSAKPKAEKHAQDPKATTKKDGAKAKQYGKPVTFCTASSRWRDARGRYCREPSPARPSEAAF
jgi:hypothetical protein